MPKHGKRYLESLKTFDRDQLYSVEEAVEIVKKNATAKFDETIEVHFKLGIDPRHSDQQLRSTVLLPNGLGKKVRVLVFAEGEAAKAAADAGADYIVDTEIMQKIQNGWFDFDAAIAMADQMPSVGRLARVLGPRGLMPNPKSGTVVATPDLLGRAIEEAKAGRVEFRNDKTGNLHIPAGKASFDLDKLIENVKAVYSAIEANKPSGVKGIYMRRVVITSTMGPGVRVAVTGASNYSAN
ncbi:50S ribosomal protein L1 [Anaerolineales bacterium]